MSNRAAPFVTTLSILAFMAWLGLSTGDVSGPDRRPEEPVAGPSHAQHASRCDVPIGWHVAEVDPRFGLTAHEVEAATREAAALWEGATGGSLFTEDSLGGLPVRLVYDHRQVRTEERLRAEGLVRRGDEILDRRTVEISRAWEAHHDELASLAVDRAALRGAIAEHNRAARGWNDRGGAPDHVAAEIAAEGRRLRTLQDQLSAAARRLQAGERALQIAEAELMSEVAERNEKMGILARTFPPTAVESGAYLDAELKDASGASHIRREIRVFRFQDREELVLVLAHELGHALGLGHVAEPDAIMAGLQGGSESLGTHTSLQEVDVSALRDLCGGATSR